jgi:ActR/RegA family two-component response regulator
MSDVMPLEGRSVLVIEDEFYLAEDLRQALENAGAMVLGPCANAENALDLLKRTEPDCAAVDLNLGFGRTFGLAEAIRAREIPMVLVTGYDLSGIPPQLADLPLLQKPAHPNRVVAVLAKLLAKRTAA